MKLVREPSSLVVSDLQIERHVLVLVLVLTASTCTKTSAYQDCHFYEVLGRGACFLNVHRGGRRTARCFERYSVHLSIIARNIRAVGSACTLRSSNVFPAMQERGLCVELLGDSSFYMLSFLITYTADAVEM